jgi:predicted nuclease with RNAse H fold
MTVYIGIDLTAGQRPSSLAALDAAARLLAQGEALADADIRAWVATYPATIVAMDAPLSLPLGLCCLEASCDCRPVGPDSYGGRACERALSRLGIGCYYTTKRSIIKAMVYRAIALKATLEADGHRVIEVYPHASRARLFGKLPKKSTAAGRSATQQGLMSLVAGLSSPDEELLGHDTLDAVLAAYTGWLFARGQAVALGDPAEGLLYIPA